MDSIVVCKSAAERIAAMSQRLQSRPSRSSVDAALTELAAALGNRLVTSQAVRDQHTNTTTWSAGEAPDGVIFPQSSGEVQVAMRICAGHGVPVIPFGAGSSLEGHVNAPLGGISFDLKDLNRILAVNAEDSDCVVEPGVTRSQLNDYLRDQGLFFPIDPGADAHMGGMAATRASGTTAVRYGTMKDAVLAMKVVLPSGELLTTSRRARKSSAGYDLTRLFVGAEGTLGIITELTLRLHPIPEAIAGGTCRFPTIKASCDAAIMAIQMGIPLARVELVDEQQIRICNAYSKLTLPEQPTLFVEFHGSDAGVKEQSERFSDIVAEFGGSPFEWTAKAEDRTRLWKARHDLFWADKAYRAGSQVVVTDVCVPISRLAECVTETQADIERSRLIAPLFGHVGDGNFHTVISVMTEDADEVARVKGFVGRLAERALAMEGTCTGEHGIGDGKQKYLVEELEAPAVRVMRSIKQVIDPAGIMNPGKIF
jgi:D-lactate dehydrogenase (cytochrome)